MKSKTVICVVMALSMSTGSLAFAQGNGNRDRDGHSDRGDRGDRGQAKQMQRGNDHRQARAQPRHDARGFGRRHEEEMRGGRGAGPNHVYYRGDRFPAEYRSRQYVVDDWRGHHLSAPPRGYHWVQSGGDYVLVAIATGVILQLLLGH